MSPGPVLVRLRASRILAALLIFLHGLALTAVATALDGAPLAFAAVGVVLSALAGLRDVLQYGRGAAMAIELYSDGRVAWQGRSGQWHEVRAVGGSSVMPWLVILALAGSDGRRKWVVIGPDAASGDDLRRLRLWARLCTGKNVPASE